ncbi:MAG TPA: alpha/beta fold hydrolase [Tepidisphaeraceae bacterium]|jgi:hypothetical protein|nr:alpha/beta fold hydrolase [Tepidisphaeraceae bacterium]
MPPFITLPIILLAVAVLLYFLIPLPMARKLLRPPRMSDGKAIYLLKRLSPADLDMPYEPLSFPIRDQQTGSPLTIASWWIPNPNAPNSPRTALLIHGYADAKVGSIAWAPLFHTLGYHVLAIDLRAHGDSTGLNVTAGFWDRHDLSQVIDQLRHQRPHQTQELILFGISLGAAVAIATAELRDDLTAVIVESPFADYPTAILSHANLMGMPGPSFVRRAISHAQRLSQSDFQSVTPARLIPLIHCPILVISAGNDPLVGTSLPELQSAINQRHDHSQFWQVDGAYHVESLLSNREEYLHRIQCFLSTAPSSPPTPHP